MDHMACRNAAVLLCPESETIWNWRPNICGYSLGIDNNNAQKWQTEIS